MIPTSKLDVLKNLGVSPSALPGIQQYIEELWSANKDLNLFSRQMTIDELIDNHLIDCFLPLKYFPSNAKSVADFGSGGGLPGVLYALNFQQITFHLFEKSPKKQEFLQRCQKWAPNLQVHAEITPSALNKIDLVIARAFKPLDVILTLSREYYLSGGSYFLLKGRKEKIQEEILLAKKKFKALQIEILPLTSPLLEVERHLVKAQKN